MIKKFVLNYIRKYAHNYSFMKEIMCECHCSRQEHIDDQSVLGRVYDVFGACADAVPGSLKRVFTNTSFSEPNYSLFQNLIIEKCYYVEYTILFKSLFNYSMIFYTWILRT